MDLSKHPEHDHGYIDIINETEANEGYECIPEVAYNDGESSYMAKASSNGHTVTSQKINEGYESDKQYESLHAYAEIPNMNYESLNPPDRMAELDLTLHTNPEQIVPSASNSMPTLHKRLQRKTCCGKSACFWIPLTVAVAIVIAILVVVVITGICLLIRFFCFVCRSKA